MVSDSNIANTDGKGPVDPKTKSERKLLHCSFCGKSQHEVKKLIGDTNSHTYICEECVDLCEDIVLEKAGDAFLVRIRLPSGANGGETLLATAISELLSSQFVGWAVEVKEVVRNRNDHETTFLKVLVRPAKDEDAEIKKEISDKIQRMAQELSVITTKYLNEKHVREKLERDVLTIKSDYYDFVRSSATVTKVAPMRVLRAILFLDIVGFSKLDDLGREDRLDFLRSVARPLLRNKGASEVNMWGDGVIAAFEDETIVVDVASAFLRHLAVEQAECRIAIAWGEVRMVYNDGIERLDYDGAVVNRAARLEPLAEAGEILLSEEFKGIAFPRDKLSIREREVALGKAFGEFSAGDLVRVLSVRPIGN